MKILMLVNWKIEYCNEKPAGKQSPDYKVKGEDYWFYRYFKDKPEVEVLDIRSFPWLEKFERNRLHFYIWQAIRAIPKLNKYDLVVSHGMPSAVVICLWRRFFKTKAKHVVFDIGSFASGSERGFALKLMQFASKSIDGIIYHTSWQKEYYDKYFAWLSVKAYFVPFGVDFDFFDVDTTTDCKDDYILCVGKNRSDWNTVAKAFSSIETSYKLRFVGGNDSKLENLKNVEQLPYIPINELIIQIKNALFCVLPLENVRFSFGQMRFLQQQALGKCVLASRIRSLVDYGKDNINSIFFEPGNTDDCRSKMEYLLNHPSIIDTIGKNARDNAHNCFNEKTMALQIECVLGEVINVE